MRAIIKVALFFILLLQVHVILHITCAILRHYTIRGHMPLSLACYNNLKHHAHRMVWPPDDYSFRRKFLHGLPHSIIKSIFEAHRISAKHSTIKEILKEVQCMETAQRQSICIWDWATLAQEGNPPRDEVVQTHMKRRKVEVPQRVMAQSMSRKGIQSIAKRQDSPIKEKGKVGWPTRLRAIRPKPMTREHNPRSSFQG